MNEILIGFLTGFAPGLIPIVFWFYKLIAKFIKFRPYRDIWKDFDSKNTVILLTSHEQGHSLKISFNEYEAAQQIQKLLNVPLESIPSMIHTDQDLIDYSDKNIIVLGSEHVNELTRLCMETISGIMNYSYTVDNDLIVNNRVYESEYKNDILVKDYALVIKMDSPLNPKRKMFVFAGNHGLGTQAAVLALINKIKVEEVIKEVGNSNFYLIVESSFAQRFSKKPLETRIDHCVLLGRLEKSASKSITVKRSERVKDFLLHLGAKKQLIDHLELTSKIALSIGRIVEKRGKNLDLNAIYFGAMFHDVGRVRTQEIDHGIEGANLIEENRDELVRQYNLMPHTFIKIIEAIECHIVGGIPSRWITESSLNLPERDFIPKSIEAKIVSISDQLTHKRDVTQMVFREDPTRDKEVFANLYNLCRDILQLPFASTI